MQRGLSKSPDFRRVYLRRLGILWVLGLLHGIFLFEGDILFFYSMAGALLLACHRFSVRRLVAVGLALLAVGIGLSVLWSAIGEGGFALDDEATREAMLVGPLGLTIKHRAISFFSLQIVFTIISFNWRVVAMFFFGAALMKSRALDASKLGLHKRLAAAGLSLGLLLEAYGIWASDGVGLDASNTGLGTMAHELGSLTLAMGLAATVCWMVHTGRCQQLCAWLAALGRSALTNYLLQSIFMNLLLMWFGFGLWGQLSRLQVIAIVCLLFPLQVFASVLWTRRFAYGPAEWLWRWATYGRRPRWRL
jgi:uncharacterized protein